MKLRLSAFLPALALTCHVAMANTFTASGSFPGDLRAAVTRPGMPWRCIGKLSEPGSRFMTATLVGPNLILTAAHGLVKDGKLKPGHFIFRPDFGSPHNRTAEFATVTKFWLGSTTPEKSPCLRGDWAILQLDKNLGDTYGRLAVDDIDEAALAAAHRLFYISSYNKDENGGRAASWETGRCFLPLEATGYLLHDFSTANGASGAPIFYLSGPSAKIVALNVAEKTRNGETIYHVPFSPSVANVAIAAHEFFQTLSAILDGKAMPSITQAPIGAQQVSPPR